MTSYSDLNRYDNEIAEAEDRVHGYRQSLREDVSIRPLQERILRGLEDDLASLKKIRDYLRKASGL